MSVLKVSAYKEKCWTRIVGRDDNGLAIDRRVAEGRPVSEYRNFHRAAMDFFPLV